VARIGSGASDGRRQEQSEEFLQIARLQRWLEDDLAGQAKRVLFCDTDAETTAAFHEVYLGSEAPDELRAMAAAEAYDLYLLCEVATPFEQDGYRTGDAVRRRWMHERYRRFLDARGARYVQLTGGHSDRLATAVAAVDSLVAPSRA